MDGNKIQETLKGLLGADKVRSDPQQMVSYSTDLFPRNQILKVAGEIPATEPHAVCFPDSVEDIAKVMAFCSQCRLPLIPYAAGSGVCGATIPEHGGVVMDVKGLDEILDFNPEDETVTVMAGLMGERLEDFLNSKGFTLGHFPSSFRCSSVGGWVACRSAGQFSSRYGKIEHMTLGAEVVIPPGRVVQLGILGGGHPSDPMLDLMLGSEGTLGVLTRVVLKVEPLPPEIDFRGFAFVDVESGIDAMRRIMQAPLKPTVMRLYDPLDSLIAGFHSKPDGKEDLNFIAARLKGVKKLVADAVTGLNSKALTTVLYRPKMLNNVTEILPARPLMIVGVQGDKPNISGQWDEVGRQVKHCRGEDLGPEPGFDWYKRRYAVSYKQSKIFRTGAFVDTMEVATTWDNLFPLYKAIFKAMAPHVFIMAHFSHAYEDGCSIYFTFAGYRPSKQASLSLYQRTWQAGQGAILRHGGTITHHHGVGILKRPYLERDTPGGHDLFAAVKKAVDSPGVCNPGKLYGVD